MIKFALAVMTLIPLALAPATDGDQLPPGNPRLLDELISLERAALDKWIRRDPQGYLDLYAPDVSYFDPFTRARLDGVDAIKAMVAAMIKAAPPNPVTEPRYELIGARVQQYGEVGILTFQVMNYGRVNGAAESVLARWNSTETYRRIAGRWRIVHSHWSFTTPK
jgi:ketosteroid isomerase-like protein